MELFGTGKVQFDLLDTHDTVAEFMDQLIKWGFIDFKDLV